MSWSGRRSRARAHGRGTQSNIDGVIRRGLAATADPEDAAGRRAAQTKPVAVDPAEAGCNPYDTLGPETLNRLRPKSPSSGLPVPNGGAGDPYDTASERLPKRRSWDDALIDTDDRR
jgi:hypothetical protein